MCAFRHVTQKGTGWWIGVCADLIHFAPGAVLSQRVSPMITAAGPFTIWYLSLLGAASVQCVCRVRPIPDESRSSVVSVCRPRNVRVARLTSDVPSGGGHCFGSCTVHGEGVLPATRTSIAFGVLPAGAVAR